MLVTIALMTTAEQQNTELGMTIGISIGIVAIFIAAIVAIIMFRKRRTSGGNPITSSNQGTYH